MVKPTREEPIAVSEAVAAEPEEPIGWDPIETQANDTDAVSGGESPHLESLLEQIPPALQESLQSHLMGTFVRTRKVDKRDFLFAEATTDTLSADNEPEIIVEDTEEVD